MAITLVGVASSHSGAGSWAQSYVEFSRADMGTLIEGDLMVAGLNTTSNATITAPAGWTLLAAPTPYQRILRVYWKKYTASDPTVFRWTAANGSGPSLAAVALRNSADPSTVASNFQNSTYLTGHNGPRVAITEPTPVLTVFGNGTNNALSAQASQGAVTELYKPPTGNNARTLFLLRTDATPPTAEESYCLVDGSDTFAAVAIPLYEVIDLPPNKPTSVLASDVTVGSPVSVSWQHNDPENGAQVKRQLRWRLK